MRKDKRTVNRVLSPASLHDEETLLDFFGQHNIKPIHAINLWKHTIRNDSLLSAGVDFTQVPRLPVALPALLKERFVFTTSRVKEERTSADGSTTKLLIELQDKQLVESVIIRNKHTNDDQSVEKWVTLCVSSQVGCQMACSFCATGTMGLKGNLSAGEIVEQLVHASRRDKVRNVVFMGMGEPLHNYDAVLSAVRAMVDTNRFGLAPSRVTVSTVGIVPRMLQLAKVGVVIAYCFLAIVSVLSGILSAF